MKKYVLGIDIGTCVGCNGIVQRTDRIRNRRILLGHDSNVSCICPCLRFTVCRPLNHQQLAISVIPHLHVVKSTSNCIRL